MSLFLSRVFTHALLAGAFGAGTFLFLEWLIPGSVTTAIPLYPLIGLLIVVLFIGARCIPQTSKWKSFMGALIVIMPVLILASAFALNEGSNTILLFSGLAWLLALVLLGATLITGG